MEAFLVPEVYNAANQAGATIIVLALLYFALKVYKMQHERIMVRDKMFIDAFMAQYEALLECISKDKDT